MIYVACNSNGKDSMFMILELIRRKYPLDLVLFFDSGKEFGAIYDIWEQLKKTLDDNEIAWDVIYPDYSFDYGFSEKPVAAKDGSEKNGYSWCGGICRWMTSLKTQAFQKYYKQHYGAETIVEYVGLAADELSRVKAPVKSSNILKLYPLITWGYTENDCFVGCYKAGYSWKEPNTDIELYKILDRVSCWCCGNKNLEELKNIYLHLPDYWEKLKIMQEKTALPMKKSGTIHELEKRFQEETTQEKYKQISIFDL